MIRIAIVEDEEQYINQLTGYLTEYQTKMKEEMNIAVYHDGDEITSKYKSQYDIIFMDIKMKFIDGMTAAEEIRKVDSKVIIIFVTNMKQYAIHGYKVGALNYIVKPISYLEFSKHLEDAIARIKRQGRNYVTFPIKGGIRRLDISDIYYIESQGHNLIYHTSSGRHLSSGTLSDMEKQLSSYGYSRGNKSYLINLMHVDGIQDKCALVKGETLQLSRPRYTIFMSDLTKYWAEN
jgi:DNA-binding LytR/AlgR family response regulator